MVDHRLGIDSSHLDDSCGDSLGYTCSEALDGTKFWYHSVTEVHWFVLDLVQTYTIKKVYGRSLRDRDPINVNIYIDNNNPPTTLCEEGITTWQDTDEWVEIILTTEGIGRYIKVEIEATEDANHRMEWGTQFPSLPIFDAYGDIYVPPPPAVPRPTAAVGNPYIF